MADFRHQIMGPEQLEVAHQTQVIEQRHARHLTGSWLVETSGEGFTTLYPDQWGEWSDKPVGCGRIAVGYPSVTIEQVDELIDRASNRHSPEPVPPSSSSHQDTLRIGFDIWGMGRHLQAIFYKGRTDFEDIPPVPDSHWFLANTHLWREIPTLPKQM
jgi:hypothetical protein